MARLTLAITGIKGRMGRQIASLALDNPEIELLGGTVAAGDPAAGTSLEFAASSGEMTGVPVFAALSDMQQAPDVVIDFTAPAATIALLPICVERQSALVIGTTGFDAAQEEMIVEAARHIPVVKSGNMSLGVTLLEKLVGLAAMALDETYDIEIHEAHHKHKKDAPSGTALMLGRAAAAGRKIDFDSHAVYDRSGQTGERDTGKIGFSVTRAGGIIGEHEVMFGAGEEVITLSHKALNRAVFARGALAAATWLETGCEEPGLYAMSDVLGL